MKKIFCVLALIAIAASCAFADGVSTWIDPKSYDKDWIDSSASSQIAYLGYYGNQASIDPDGTVTFDNVHYTFISYTDPQDGQMKFAFDEADVPADATDVNDMSWDTTGRLMSAVAQGSWLVNPNVEVGTPIDIHLTVEGLSDEGKADLMNMVALSTQDGTQRNDNYRAYLYDSNHNWLQWVGPLSFDGDTFVMRGEVNNALLRAGEIGYIEFDIPIEGKVFAYDATTDNLYQANIGTTPDKIKLGKVDATTVPEPATYAYGVMGLVSVFGLKRRIRK